MDYGRKLGPGVARGMGSGIPANQSAVGAPNAEMAARLAALPAGELQRAMDQVEKRSAEMAELKAELEALIAAGKWEAPKPLDLSSFEELLQWKTEHDEKVKAEADKKEKDSSAAMAASFGPDHPLYDPLRDTARRLRIEKTLDEMDFDEMVFSGYCDQQVAIRESFHVVFRTLPTQHGLWLEIKIAQAERSSEQHLRHTFSLMQVAASVQTINDKPLGADLSKFTKESHREDFFAALEKRLTTLGRMPGVLTDDLIVHYTWFSGRVRKLLLEDVNEKVGN